MVRKFIEIVVYHHLERADNHCASMPRIYRPHDEQAIYPVARVKIDDPEKVLFEQQALDIAFRHTNTVDEAWTGTPLHTPISVLSVMPMLRSTSVGDVMHLPQTNTWWRVAPMGFDELTPEDMEEYTIYTPALPPIRERV